ncbi:succinate dehydrogenase, hydrophobic membrane anchor protein [Bordetella sp. FB-8]|uniref:succinate dehydrogenase, hydrophobic membrane anchor protein n=1 Tax=Bordetella sp. FB-8 TaxID=1159870 RepID=UPI0003790CAE|nr:succinate dehydrogenase, hydrophobic membrane anchor protein [Bordetella sp. FB-8]
MAASNNYGPKRLVVGAHYGIADFIAQRVTAVIMAVYTVILVIGLLVEPLTYEGWKSLFTFHVYTLPVGQILASLAFIALAWHAWIGVRDIWMDYVRSVGVRLLLQVLTLLWLIGSLIYFAQILWRI